MYLIRTFRKFLSVGIVVLMTIMSACSSATIVPTSTPISPKVYRIAFDSNSSIYSVNADGSNLMQLVKRGGGPVWSPDGQFIAFGNSQVYIVDINGGKPMIITKEDSTLPLSSVGWSPDGKQIAFAVNGGGGNGKIYVINNIEQIRQGKNNFSSANYGGIDAKGLNWSPNGKYLVFSYREEIHESNKVAVLDINTGKLTNIIYSAWGPTWSPDGKRLAVVSGPDWKGDIYIIDDVAQAIQKFKFDYPRLTNNDADDESPVWSPDGKQIAFLSNRDGNWEIYTMNADGSHQTRLTNNPADDLQPTWSPDSKQIAFVSQRDGNWEIYVMDANGSNFLRLTNNAVDDFNPVWQPQQMP